MKSSYSILFNIQLQHEYFLNRICKDFEIVPAQDCLAAFKKLKMLWRPTDDGGVALIEEDDQHLPVVSTPAANYFQSHYGKTVFRFYLKLKKRLFLNYTNIDAAYDNYNKFYFSNGAKNKSNGNLYLSAPAAPFANNKQYLPGNLATDPQTGKTYESLRKYTSKKKSELTEATFWAPKDLQYASGADIIAYSSGSYVFNLTEPVEKATITIFGFNYNAAAPAYDLQAKDPIVKTFTSSTAKVPVDLTSLQAGQYLIKVNNETAPVYYDPAANPGATFGVIEVFNFLSGNDDYSLLTGDQKIKNVNYQICFPARRALWKYIRKDGKAQAITDTGKTGYKFALTGDEFVSSVPIPFSEVALKTLQLEFNTSDFRLFPLPNPSVERLINHTQNDSDYFCSEMNLNY